MSRRDPNDPQPPSPRGPWIIPQSEWAGDVIFKNGVHQTLFATAPFVLFARGILARDANALYPEGGGIKRLRVRFIRRVPPV